MMFSSEFFKKAFRGNSNDQADQYRMSMQDSLEKKRQSAIQYLGEKWLLHPNNHIAKK